MCGELEATLCYVRFHLSKPIVGLVDGSVGKDVSCQAKRPAFDGWDSHGRYVGGFCHLNTNLGAS